jgi:hypothetical protein
MTITEIKIKLGVTNLNLNTSNDAQGNPTDWMTDWVDATRTRISIHKDTVKAIKANPSMSNLGLQTEEKESQESGKPYSFNRIVMYTEAETVL